MNDFTLNCPLPIKDYPTVQMGHGGGGRLMQQLIDRMFVATFANPRLERRHDGAVLDPAGRQLAFTTDSYVVRPLFFPGGDIGSMAVHGTVNDLAMCGARARWLSAGFIIEEGLAMETLWRVVQSMGQAARSAGVEIVTGDTKVVDKGKGDQIFINTAGVGTLEGKTAIEPASVKSGDAVLISGDIGRHGMAIMSVREGLEFDSPITSDCAPLVEPVMALLEQGIEIHCLRDLTRGGLASAANEIAQASQTQLTLEQDAVPVNESVRGACEILGLDPLYVANEGRFMAVIAEADADKALEILTTFPETAAACRIGCVTDRRPGLVTLKSPIGAERILDLLSGEQLPRIC